MAGSFISVDVRGQKQISQALNRLLKQGSDLKPALTVIGEHLLESTQERMKQEQAPDGTTWDPLSINTILNKDLTGQSDSILRGYGTLADTLNYQIGANQMMLGTPLEYGASHQFGRDEANIPARPFLGFSENDESEILDILRDHLIDGV